MTLSYHARYIRDSKFLSVIPAHSKHNIHNVSNNANLLSVRNLILETGDTIFVFQCVATSLDSIDA